MESQMKTIQISIPLLCCSSGVRGPETDPRRKAFAAADFEWARTQGVNTERFNCTATIALRTERNR